MRRLLTRLIGVSLTIFSLTGTSAVADHMPNKMMRNFLAWSRLGDTGVLGPFEVNFAKFGSRPDMPTTSAPNEAFSEFLVDKWNLASIVTKDGEIIHEYYRSSFVTSSVRPVPSFSNNATHSIIASCLKGMSDRNSS